MSAPTGLGWLRFALPLLLALAGCANLHFDHGQASLGDKSLVFGKMLLVRDGEKAAINATGVPITLGRLPSAEEPLLVTEPFEASGRFYWSLAPGKYLLNISLNQARGEVVSLAFSVPAASRAYYLGDLILSGNKRFSALGAANIQNVSAALEDDFDAARAELLRRNPDLAAGPERLAARIVDNASSRRDVLAEELHGAPLCCRSLGELPFEKLEAGAARVFEAGEARGAFQFPEGRSYFIALELPPYRAPYAISLRSLVAPSGMPGRLRVFVPAALLLDAGFGVVESIPTDLLRPLPASLLPPRAASLAGEIRLGAENARARYLVLYTTPQLLGPTQATTTPGMFVIPGGALPSGARQRADLEPWPTGRLEIGVAAQ